jgi:hypothetical protein
MCHVLYPYSARFVPCCAVPCYAVLHHRPVACRYESHLRTRAAAGAKGGASSSNSARTAPTAGTSASSSSTPGRTSATGPSGSSSTIRGSAATVAGLFADHGATSCDTCGKMPEDGAKLLKCSRCKLRAYCGKECQAADWPTHKAPCKMVSQSKGCI